MASAGDDVAPLQAAFFRGEYPQVAAGAEQLLARESLPATVEALLYLKGISELKIRDLEAARITLTRLTTEFPGGRFLSQGEMALGDVESLSGAPEKALWVYQNLAGSEKASAIRPQVALRLGDIQRRLGLWEEARKTLEHLVGQFPRSDEASQAKEILSHGEFAFSVQVGAFQSRENALKLAAELKRRNFSADVNDVIVEGKRFYRVRVGQFADRGEAVQEVQRLKAEGFPGKVVP